MRGVKYESVYKIAETMFFCSYVKKNPFAHSAKFA